MNEYRDQWIRFKRARNITLIILIGGCVVDLFGPPVYETLAKVQDDAKFSAILFVVWAIASVVASQRLMNWKCPRCGKVYCGGAKAFDRLSAWFNWLILPPQCAHCGLPKYSPSSDASDIHGSS